MIHDEAGAHAYVAALCDDAAMARLDVLADLMRAENERQNLIAKPTVEALWLRHIADSAQLLTHVPRETSPAVWLDLGTGAGFPGLVIAAMRPDWPVCLIESRKLRIEWLEHARIALGLDRCEVLGERLENVTSFPAAVISARAFAPMPRLLDLSLRFSTGDTIWLLPKGRSAKQDLASLPAARRALFHVEQSQTDPEAGIIVGRVNGSARRKP